MARISISLIIFVAMFACSIEVQGQIQTPLRNLARFSGFGWDTGHHFRNPGHDTRYYSPWSMENSGFHPTPVHSAPAQPQEEPAPGFQPIPVQSRPALEINESSASILTAPTSPAIHQPFARNGEYQVRPGQQTGTYEDSHRKLNPYHSSRPSAGSSSFHHQGAFQIPPRQQPAGNFRWKK